MYYNALEKESIELRHEKVKYSLTLVKQDYALMPAEV